MIKWPTCQPIPNVLAEIAKLTPSAFIDLEGIDVGQNSGTNARISKLQQSCDVIDSRVKSLALISVATQQVPRKVERALQHLFAIVSDVRRLLHLLVLLRQIFER